MIRTLIAFFILLASVFLGLELKEDPGYMLISLHNWTIESTLLVASLALILFFIMLHCILHLIYKLYKAPSTFSHWNLHRLTQKAQDTTRKGLIEYSEGYWQKAKKHLIQALPNTDTPLINYLTAARAAQKMGDSALRDHYLREAQQSMPEAKIAVELTQAQLQLSNHQWEQALATLRHLQDLAPHHPYVLKLLMNLYIEVRDWPQLIALLPDLKRNKVISDEHFNQLEEQVYVHSIMDMVKQNQNEAVKLFFNSLPKPLFSNPRIIAEYVRFLLKNNEYAAAEHLIRQYLRKQFNDELIELYGLTLCNENQLPFAESLLKKNAHSASLFLCLGRLCMAQHLWGKAKNYFEQANQFNPSPITYKELGLLYEKLHDIQNASEQFKKGLELATQNQEKSNKSSLIRNALSVYRFDYPE